MLNQRIGNFYYLCIRYINHHHLNIRLMTDFNKEWEKMLAGEIYEAGHPAFLKKLVETREKLWEFNNMRPSRIEEMQALLRGLLGGCGKNFTFNQPFRCDYGCNIYIGENFIANFNFTVLDEGEVRIGDNVFIGPNVSIYTACHPLDPDERNTWVEWAEGVTIGNNVWIGGSSTILPGVKISNNVVIGGGSVVTRDIPDNVVAVGNPARVIKQIPVKKDDRSGQCSVYPSDFDEDNPVQLGLDSCGD